MILMKYLKLKDYYINFLELYFLFLRINKLKYIDY